MARHCWTRLVLKTNDGTAVTMRDQGVRHGPPKVIAQREAGGVVDPARYYFRINPVFEAPAGPYEWLNRILAIGTGHRLPEGPVHSVFEVP